MLNVKSINWSLELPMIESLCANYYDAETLAHARRVAQLVKEDPRAMRNGPDFRDFCIALAYCRDLWEDTTIAHDEFPEDLTEGIQILTKEPCESYKDYCARISGRDSEWYMTEVEYAAWLVKINDMKDHLMQKDTLNDRLKAKYLEGMAYLL